MSKVTKFLSIGIDMYKGMADAAEDKNRVYLDAGPMEKVLIKFENQIEALEKEKTDFPKAEAVQQENLNKVAGIPEGTVKVTTSSNGKPLLCEVKFYPVMPGENLETDYKATKRIDFTRIVTGEDGTKTVSLTEGKYLVKASKGSEYELEYKNIEVTGGETTEVSFDLTQFVDISKEGYFAGDLHHHSIFSSPVWGGTDDVIESPKEVCDSMRAMGLKFGALSDHHNILNHKEWKACKTEDFLPIPSKEISTSNGHVLALGVDEYDVIYQIPKPLDRTENYLRKEFVRITDEIREKKGLPQLNHPRDLSVSISWNRDFYDMTEIFETMEIWNGSHPMFTGTTPSLAADFWRSLLDKGVFIPATTGSDTHNIRANDYHALTGRLYDLACHYETYKDKVSLDNKEMYILKSFVNIVNTFLPMMEIWAKTCLTSGCVRTYVHLENGEEPSRENVLNALRSGHSFLTNGPILTVKVNGSSMGETVLVENGKADVSVRLLSNRKLTKVVAYMSNNKAVDIPLKELPTASHYDYSFDMKDFFVGDSKYIFFVAFNEDKETVVTNLAITNPVLIL